MNSRYFLIPVSSSISRKAACSKVSCSFTLPVIGCQNPPLCGFLLRTRKRIVLFFFLNRITSTWLLVFISDIFFFSFLVCCSRINTHSCLNSSGESEQCIRLRTGSLLPKTLLNSCLIARVFVIALFPLSIRKDIGFVHKYSSISFGCMTTFHP